MSEEVKLSIVVMSINKAKGFLKNKAKLAKIVANLQNPETPDEDDSMAQYILMHTLQPTDRKEALDLILDLSNEELMEAVSRIKGEPIVPLQSAGPSETTTS